MLYRLLTHTVCEQATMGVFTGNDHFCVSVHVYLNLLHSILPSLKMWTEASSTGHGTTTDVL